VFTFRPTNLLLLVHFPYSDSFAHLDLFFALVTRTLTTHMVNLPGKNQQQLQLDQKSDLEREKHVVE
jgi:hypothetical protein